MSQTKIIVYIDGYNLYYSRLRGSAYKWLDVVALFRDEIVRRQLPDAQLLKVKYFTAPALAKFATHGKESVTAQNEYLRALKALHGERFEVIHGKHSVTHPRAMLYREPPDKSHRVEIWQLEEKQTDVNIALAMYADAANQRADVQIICSNDSDMVPVMRALRTDFSGMEIGLVAPLPEPAQNKLRPANAELLQLAHWSRKYIRDEELMRSQLPTVVSMRKKAARKPAHW